jgi:hypothetical protein
MFKAAATVVLISLYRLGIPFLSVAGLFILWMADPIGSLLIDEKGHSPAWMIKIAGWALFVLPVANVLKRYVGL